ncbi:dITP/XTP pyrophosphatase [Lysinibacillus sphaericus]
MPSARYAGDHDDEANMVKLLQNLQGIEDNKRTARFCCCIAIAGPDFETTTVFGTCEGVIAHEKRGTNGFGYDTVFFVPSLNRMMAELTPEEKGAISHRGNAIRKLNRVHAPKLAILNEAVAKSLGLDYSALQQEDGIEVLAGNEIPKGALPLAQAYAGHQFGHFNMLGDGRALLLGEQITPSGERYDIGLNCRTLSSKR